MTRRFGRLTAVNDLTLTIPRGEVFGFLGPNGAGKTTTVRMLTTLIYPTSGTAHVAGYNVVEDPHEVQARIGLLPERMPLYEAMTAREFLHTFARIHRIPRDQRRDRIEHLLDLVNLHDVRGQPAGTFSKGMRQRLGLATALLHEPEVLFLDEPASGLDPTGQREIRTLLKDIADEGATIFLCTHDLAQARAVCHRVGFIQQGELTAVQSLEDVSLEDLEHLYHEHAEQPPDDATNATFTPVTDEPRGDA